MGSPSAKRTAAIARRTAEMNTAAAIAWIASRLSQPRLRNERCSVTRKTSGVRAHQAYHIAMCPATYETRNGLRPLPSAPENAARMDGTTSMSPTTVQASQLTAIHRTMEGRLEDVEFIS